MTKQAIKVMIAVDQIAAFSVCLCLGISPHIGIFLQHLGFQKAFQNKTSEVHCPIRMLVLLRSPKRLRIIKSAVGHSPHLIGFKRYLTENCIPHYPPPFFYVCIMPWKMINVRAMMPVIINVMPGPSRPAGIFAFLSFSRMPAIRIIAMHQPSPAPKP